MSWFMPMASSWRPKGGQPMANVVTGKHRVESLKEAKRWLVENGYTRVRGYWMSNSRSAQLTKLVGGRVLIQEGMPV